MSLFLKQLINGSENTGKSLLISLSFSVQAITC